MSINSDLCAPVLCTGVINFSKEGCIYFPRINITLLPTRLSRLAYIMEVPSFLAFVRDCPLIRTELMVQKATKVFFPQMDALGLRFRLFGVVWKLVVAAAPSQYLQQNHRSSPLPELYIYRFSSLV